MKDAVACYKRLGEATVASLDEVEIIKIVKARKELRKYSEECEAYLKDCQEKFKPEGWEDMQTKIAQWQREGEHTTLTEAERAEINGVIVGYTKKVDVAMKEELEREVEVQLCPLKIESVAKIVAENKWKQKELDELELMV